ncbi:hypothetical protein BCV70DRAFT_202803 [Testicularia cyperi]|uniref:Uncharacterized protein n=1 Tax=Testicularia cyperi TaxID=1882483 RepID=A0A317XI15_9BASI|nr:hypothetical protein BCV70DRAFT_202803 [Testicularia cyperi]
MRRILTLAVAARPFGRTAKSNRKVPYPPCLPHRVRGRGSCEQSRQSGRAHRILQLRSGN